MGLFEKIFPKVSVDEVTNGYFKTLVGYTPIFTSFGGGIYEADLCRSAVHAFASHCSKLKPVISGSRQDLQKILEYQPNPWMDTTKFLYKVATIMECDGTAFIVPMYDKYYEKVIGFYPVRPTQTEIRNGKNGEPYVVFRFASGERTAIEFNRVGIITKYFFKEDFFGTNNSILKTTLDLIETQRQGIQEGIKQSATIRFLAKLATTLKQSDIEAERKRWNSSNLATDNNGGIAIFDAKYASVQQVNSTPYLVSAEQMQTAQESVFNYFGVSKEILQNNFTPEQWAAFYEAKVEPFALQLSLVLSNMLFTAEQKVRGNQIAFTSNRLQYASTSEKLAVVQQMTDRGMMTRNEGREIFNLDPIPAEDGGDDFIIRGEYYNANDKVKEGEEKNEEGM